MKSPNAICALVLCSMILSLMVGHRDTVAQFFPEQEPTNAEIRFGCNPGPVEPLEHADPPLPPRRGTAADELVQPAELTIVTGTTGRRIHGTGFNLEHAAWSCPAFRRVLGSWILEPFEPEIARVDSGQLPLAPEHLTAEQLGWQEYQAVMDDPKYQPSWEMLRRLNRRNVRLLLGVWGAPGAFTDDGTRRGRLIPEHLDDYVQYYEAVVDYLVNRQGIRLWSATVMNEPDGGDGTLIDPELYVDVARALGPRLAAYGVGLYGPDTASAANALPYLDALLAEPSVVAHFNVVGTHEYFAEHALEDLIRVVREGGLDAPVYVTEYTSFMFGAMDRGQETTDEVGHMLDSMSTFVSLMRAGADAALYWDTVDYYQAGHAAITRWGLLQGPDRAFQPRKRYHGFRQILPYFQSGSSVLAPDLMPPQNASTLAVMNPQGTLDDLLIVIINRGGPISLRLQFDGPAPASLDLFVTDEDRDYDWMGRIPVRGASAAAYLPAESIVTLVTGPPPLED